MSSKVRVMLGESTVIVMRKSYQKGRTLDGIVMGSRVIGGEVAIGVRGVIAVTVTDLMIACVHHVLNLSDRSDIGRGY